jgi:hypothetical protein
MKLLLSPYAKSIPSNYGIKGEDVTLGITPGESCTPDQWDKAQRQESEYYDWDSYAKAVAPTVEHPEYVRRSEEDKVFQKWEAILNELEPLPRLP